MLYLILAILFAAALSIVLKVFGEGKGNRFGIILGNYLTCVAFALAFLPQKSAVTAFPRVPFVCGVVAGLFYVGGIVSMQSSVVKNGASVTAAFAKLGLVVAVGLSLFFGEKPGVFQIAGIVIALAAVVLMNTESRKTREEKGEKRRFSPLLIAVLLTGGGSEGMSKVFDEIGTEEEKPLFLFYLFVTAAVLASVLLVVEFRRTKKKLYFRELAAGVAVGAPNYLSSYMLLKSLSVLPGVVAYPVSSGGAILVVTAVSVALLGERPAKRQAVGLGLILLSLVLLNLPV